jgi:ketosteroid isomerase-like protein
MTGPAPCPSDWALERHLLGEGPPEIPGHLAACEGCRKKLEAKVAEGASYRASAEAAWLAGRLGAPARAARRLAHPFTLASLGLAAGIAIGWGLLGRQPASNPASDEEQVRRFAAEWMEAARKKDAPALDRILADGYVYTDAGGSSTKADSLREARRGGGRTTLLRPEELDVRLFGDTAVLTGRARIQGVSERGVAYDFRYRFTDIVARIDGRWRAVAAHVSSLPPAEPPR